MTVAIKKIKSIPKSMLPKYKMIAEECCYTKIKGTLKETEFHFANKEDADFFLRILKSLLVFKNKI
jgi:hypothetical protein